MASPDNPQLEQPLGNVELQRTPAGPDPTAAATVAPAPTVPPIENPVWSGWDVLLIALLTFVTMVVLQLGIPVLAMWGWYPHEKWLTVAQKPSLLLIEQFLIYAAPRWPH